MQHKAACIIAECTRGPSVWLCSQHGLSVEAAADADLPSRLQRIKDIAGPSQQDDAALDALMTGDFDPDQYDKQMAAAFGDDYYGVCFCCHAFARMA